MAQDPVMTQLWPSCDPVMTQLWPSCYDLIVAKFGSCDIHRTEIGVSRPFSRFSADTLYSCVADDNCDYEVHVIALFRSERTFVDLNITVNGTGSRPLILVLSSHEPVQWRLRYLTPGVTIHTALVVSFTAESASLCAHVCAYKVRSKCYHNNETNYTHSNVFWIQF